MLDIKIYERKPLTVQGVEVTQANMTEVAVWCGGTVEFHKGAGSYIKVDTYRPKTPRQTMAFVGSVVLKSDEGYKIYNPEALTKGFDLVTPNEELCLKRHPYTMAPCVLPKDHQSSPLDSLPYDNTCSA